MSTITDVAAPASPHIHRIYLASFLELMHLRSDCTPPGDCRSSSRYFRSWPLTISLPSHPDTPSFGTAMYDASDTGIGFLSEKRIDPGTMVAIKLFWYDDAAPFLPAVVRHVSPHHDGYVIGCEYVLEDTRPEARKHATETHAPAVIRK